MHATPQNCHRIGTNTTTMKGSGIMSTTVRRNRRGLHQKVRRVAVLTNKSAGMQYQIQVFVIKTTMPTNRVAIKYTVQLGYSK